MNVWEATLDSRYRVHVEQDNVTPGYTATLYVDDKETGERVGQTGVFLPYGALFGPDVMDVAEWQEWAVAIVDERNGLADA